MPDTGQYHAILFKTLASSKLGQPPARLVCGTGDKRKVVGRGGEEGWGRRVVKEGGGDRSNEVKRGWGRRRRGGRRNIGRWVENWLHRTI